MFIFFFFLFFQSYWRSILAQRLVNNLRIQIRAAIQIQTYYKRYLARKKFKNFRKSVIIIQAHVRGFLLRQKLAKNASSKKLSISLPKNEK